MIIKNKLNSFKNSMQTLTLLLIVMSFVTVNAQVENVIGIWKGDFGTKQITINVEKVDNGIMYGYNSLGTNKRPISGEYGTKGDEVLAMLAEPGDDKYDGVFTITFANNTATGKWEMFKGDKSRGFVLTKEQTKETVYVEPIKETVKSTIDPKLLKGLDGNWEGEIRKGRVEIESELTITKIIGDEIFGNYTIIGSDEPRYMYFFGKLKDENNKLQLYLTETDDSTFKTFPKHVCTMELEFSSRVTINNITMYTIDGTFIGMDKSRWDVYMTKTDRVKQSADTIALNDKRIDKFEVEVQKLIKLYDQVLHFGKLSPYELIEKAENQFNYIVTWSKKNPLPSSSLTKKQDERVANAKRLTARYRMNYDLKNLMGW